MLRNSVGTVQKLLMASDGKMVSRGLSSMMKQLGSGAGPKGLLLEGKHVCIFCHVCDQIHGWEEECKNGARGVFALHAHCALLLD